MASAAAIAESNPARCAVTRTSIMRSLSARAKRLRPTPQGGWKKSCLPRSRSFKLGAGRRFLLSPTDAAHGAPAPGADPTRDAASDAANAPGEAARRTASAACDATCLRDGIDGDRLGQVGAAGADCRITWRGGEKREEREGQQEFHCMPPLSARQSGYADDARASIGINAEKRGRQAMDRRV